MKLHVLCGINAVQHVCCRPVLLCSFCYPVASLSVKQNLFCHFLSRTGRNVQIFPSSWELFQVLVESAFHVDKKNHTVQYENIGFVKPICVSGGKG